jgi:hypothetical protein
MSPAQRVAGKSHKEALRCLKRRLSDVVYRTMLRDAQAAGPGGHSGAATESSAASSTLPPLFGQVTSRTRRGTAYDRARLIGLTQRGAAEVTGSIPVSPSSQNVPP